MKRSRFTEEQIIGILKEQEAGQKTADVCRKHGVSEATFCKHKARSGGRDVFEARKPKALEDENAKLTKMLAEHMLGQCHFEGSRFKKMVTADGKRDAVVHVCGQHGLSQRRACRVLSVDRSGMRYRSIPPDDSHIRAAMKTVTVQRRRFGYRRIHVMLERQGIEMDLR